VAREALVEPDAGRYYWSELVGLEVVNAKGERLGTLRAMSSNGAHDVAEVVAERARLLPWVPAVVKRIDLAARRVEVEWEADW
jgi:16S rRNA processing protein RimM